MFTEWTPSKRPPISGGRHLGVFLIQVDHSEAEQKFRERNSEGPAKITFTPGVPEGRVQAALSLASRENFWTLVSG